MPDTRCIPKVQIISDVLILHRPAAPYKLFLAESMSRDGCERPSEMLNGPRRFIPAVEGGGDIVFLPVNSIVTVSLTASWEFRHIGAPLTGFADVRIMTADLDLDLHDGTRIRGSLQYLAPDGHSRIQDYLNRPDRFIPLQREDRVVFVNKRHVARISLGK